MRAYLQLLRLPTVFTAMADIFLGFVLTHGGLEPSNTFLLLLAASSGLYLAGMVFNDVFDRQQDARERPNRPIPSGRVSLRAAIMLGCVLMLGGVVAAYAVNSWSRVIAGALVIAILGYDAILKRTPLGPIGMGLCRFLDVMLGASDFTWEEGPRYWAEPQIVCAAGLGFYIVGVTWFARTEARKSSRRQLTGALLLLDAAIGCLAGYVYLRASAIPPVVPLLLLALIAGQLNYRASTALFDPTPEHVQPLIKQMLLNYVMLDAALIYWHTGSGPLAFGTACLVIPAMFLAKFIAMT